MPDHATATAIHAVPARLGPHGFSLLVLREFHTAAAPAAFALIAQELIRPPHRLARHGLAFALTFRPEAVAALAAVLGRPSLRPDGAPARRNPRWPRLAWGGVRRRWPDGTETTEWSAEVTFPHRADWDMFRARWREPLSGRGAAPAPPTPEARP